MWGTSDPACVLSRSFAPCTRGCCGYPTWRTRTAIVLFSQRVMPLWRCMRALALKGWLSHAELDSFCADGSLLGVHPEYQVPGIDFSAGSLGHGMGIAAGAALAALLQHSSRRIFCLISDAECNEGSVWEAIMFSAHHRLHNLTVIVDLNGQQALGRTSEVLDLANLKERWQAFGWRATEIDGHSLDQLSDSLNAPSRLGDAPHVVLARTTFRTRASHYYEGGKAAESTALRRSTHQLALFADERRRIPACHGRVGGR